MLPVGETGVDQYVIEQMVRSRVLLPALPHLILRRHNRIHNHHHRHSCGRHPCGFGFRESLCQEAVFLRAVMASGRICFNLINNRHPCTVGLQVSDNPQAFGHNQIGSNKGFRVLLHSLARS